MPDAAAGGAGHDEDAPFDAHARKRHSKWAASAGGFSVHAGTTVGAGHRAGLEKLLCYSARPGRSLERVSCLPDGRFACGAKHPIGAKPHRLMEPMEFMARLASIVAPPRYPLVRYVGLADSRRKRAFPRQSRTAFGGSLRVIRQLRRTDTRSSRYHDPAAPRFTRIAGRLPPSREERA